jgi:hypothetical protein
MTWFQIGYAGNPGYQIGHGGHAMMLPSRRWPIGSGYPHAIYSALAGVGQAGPPVQLPPDMAFACPHGTPSANDCAWCGSDAGVAAMQAMSMQALSMQQGPPVTQLDPTQLREFTIGFDSGAVLIPPGGFANVSTTLQLPFRGKRLIVSPLIASSFLIQEIRVGVTPQAAAVGVIPADTYVPESLVPLSLDTGQVGQQITISVINRSGGALRFLASITGDTAR